jgi:hypothetical protein
VLAGNPKVFAQLVQTIAPHLTPTLRSRAAPAGNPVYAS